MGNRAAVREAIAEVMRSLPPLDLRAMRRVAPQAAQRIDAAEQQVNAAAKRLLAGDDRPGDWADLDNALSAWRATLEAGKRALTGQRN